MKYSEAQIKAQAMWCEFVIQRAGDLENRIGEDCVDEYADDLRRVVAELLTYFDLEDN